MNDAEMSGLMYNEMAQLRERLAAAKDAIRGLLEIAEMALPDSYFEIDSRVQAAKVAILPRE